MAVMSAEPSHPPTQALGPRQRPAQSGAWWPAAIVSLALPLLGLLLIRDGRDRRRLAWGTFALLVGVHVVLRVLYALAGTSTNAAGIGESVAGTIIRAVEYLVTFASAAFGTILTHDETVHAHPQQGRPILFMRSPPSPGG